MSALQRIMDLFAPRRRRAPGLGRLPAGSRRIRPRADRADRVMRD